METNPLIAALEAAGNRALTENGALTNASTLDALLDFFSLGAALRERSPAEVEALFARAYAQDRLLALKGLFYVRDARGGQGERATFRTLIRWLAGSPHWADLVANLALVPEFGRWDDLWGLLDCPCRLDVAALVRRQLDADLASEHPSLLAKWLPSENATAKATKARAKQLARYLNLTPKAYRQALSKLRAKIRVVERDLCARRWGEIVYAHVPSLAALRYRKAFKAHDGPRYGDYLAGVAAGREKINAAALYPYDLVRAALGPGDQATVEAQWRALPNYVAQPEDALVVADTSGSMVSPRTNGGVAPIYVALSLALYFAERNHGPFQNRFITFSSRPQLQTIAGDTLAAKIRGMRTAAWQQNTDLQAVFALVLGAAVQARVPAAQMVKKIYIISDMEFDAAEAPGQTNLTAIRAKYAAAGYELPAVVFWNVESRHDQSPATANDRGILLVSGCSPSAFKHLIAGTAADPRELMLEVLGSPRYAAVKLAP